MHIGSQPHTSVPFAVPQQAAAQQHVQLGLGGRLMGNYASVGSRARSDAVRAEPKTKHSFGCARAGTKCARLRARSGRIAVATNGMRDGDRLRAPSSVEFCPRDVSVPTSLR